MRLVALSRVLRSRCGPSTLGEGGSRASVLLGCDAGVLAGDGDDDRDDLVDGYFAVLAGSCEQLEKFPDHSLSPPLRGLALLSLAVLPARLWKARLEPLAGVRRINLPPVKGTGLVPVRSSVRRDSEWKSLLRLEDLTADSGAQRTERRIRCVTAGTYESGLSRDSTYSLLDYICAE